MDRYTDAFLVKKRHFRYHFYCTSRRFMFFLDLRPAVAGCFTYFFGISMSRYDVTALLLCDWSKVRFVTWREFQPIRVFVWRFIAPLGMCDLATVSWRSPAAGTAEPTVWQS